MAVETRTDLSAFERIGMDAGSLPAVGLGELMDVANGEIRRSGPPEWLWDTVIDGLSKLLALRLEGTPAADTVEGTALAWIEALCHGRTWTPDDARRLRRAFSRLLIESRRWPAPRQLLDCLEPRPEPAFTPLTPGARARGQFYLQQIRETTALKAWLEAREQVPMSVMDDRLAGVRQAMRDRHSRHLLYW